MFFDYLIYAVGKAYKYKPNLIEGTYDTHLEIFKTYWWEPWFTFILLSPFFSFAKHWWNLLKQSPKKWLSFISLLLIYYVIFIQLMVIIYGVFKLRKFHVEWIEQLNLMSTVINSPIGILFGTIATTLVIVNASRFWYVLAMITYLTFEFTLKYMGVIHTDKFVLDTILSFLTFLISIVVILIAKRKMIGKA